MRKQVKKIIAAVTMCGVMLCSFSHAKAADVYGSKTKWYSGKVGNITVLSSVDENQYESRHFMKGTIYYNVAKKLTVTAYGYYRNIYGDVYKVQTNTVEENGTTVTSAKAYAAYQDVPVCDSNHKNKAWGNSSVGGSISVQRY